MIINYIISECMKMFETRTQWESDSSRINFEAVTKLSNGCSNLLLSNLPPNILRLISFIGLSGDRSLAFKELNRAIELPTVGGIFAQFCVFTFYLYLETKISLESETTSKLLKKMINKGMEMYPNVC